MALFKSKKTDKTTPTLKTDKISSATIITSCMKVTGNFEGTDTLHVDGHIVGNVTVSNTLVVGKSGIIEGKVEAKHIIINGEIIGSVHCENLEVLQTGKVSHSIEARNLLLDGTIDGDILGHESIKILENSHVTAKSIKSKTISVQGKVEGSITASEILEIGNKGFVEGQIMVKNIRTEEGGRMIGTMSTYEKSAEVPNKIEKQKTQKKHTKGAKTAPVKDISQEKSTTEQDDDFFSKS